jgi:hypothetical protein
MFIKLAEFISTIGSSLSRNNIRLVLYFSAFTCRNWIIPTKKDLVFSNNSSLSKYNRKENLHEENKYITHAT